MVMTINWIERKCWVTLGEKRSGSHEDDTQPKLIDWLHNHYIAANLRMVGISRHNMEVT